MNLMHYLGYLSFTLVLILSIKSFTCASPIDLMDMSEMMSEDMHENLHDGMVEKYHAQAHRTYLGDPPEETAGDVTVYTGSSRGSAYCGRSALLD